MKSYYDEGGAVLHVGDCAEVMAALPESSVDAIVTDPPYGLGFMGREWDTFSPDNVAARAVSNRRKNTLRKSERWPSKLGRIAQGGGVDIQYDETLGGHRRFQQWCERWAREALRVLRPGGHLVAFGGTRTSHRLVSGIEDAGFEIRDSLVWLFGSGFPKSAQPREGMYSLPRSTTRCEFRAFWRRAREMTGIALKPAHEPIVLARKPLVGTVAQNVLAYGTGALNIDAARIGTGDDLSGGGYTGSARHDGDESWRFENGGAGEFVPPVGRWPANVVLDPEAAALLDEQVGNRPAGGSLSGDEPSRPFGAHIYGDMDGRRVWDSYGDEGGPSRFYYCAKASRGEREFGLWDLPTRRRADAETRDVDAPGSNNPRLRVGERRNDHPTVKPVELMRWLVRLVTPPGGVVLDPFVGSGTTGMATLDEGFRFIGVDQERHYLEIAWRRIARRHLLADHPEPTESATVAGQQVLL